MPMYGPIRCGIERLVPVRSFQFRQRKSSVCLLTGSRINVDQLRPAPGPLILEALRANVPLTDEKAWITNPSTLTIKQRLGLFIQRYVRDGRRGDEPSLLRTVSRCATSRAPRDSIPEKPGREAGRARVGPLLARSSRLRTAGTSFNRVHICCLVCVTGAR